MLLCDNCLDSYDDRPPVLLGPATDPREPVKFDLCAPCEDALTTGLVAFHERFEPRKAIQRGPARRRRTSTGRAASTTPKTAVEGVVAGTPSKAAKAS